MDRVAGLVALLGLAAAYPLRSLLLIERDSHEGPLRLWPQRRVYFPSTGHFQRVSIFDWFRRCCGVYVINHALGQWEVRERSEAAERFTCPFCLSFWVTIPFSVGLALYLQSLLVFIPAHFAIAIIAQAAYKLLWGNDD